MPHLPLSHLQRQRDGRERRGLPRWCSWLPGLAWHPHRSFSPAFWAEPHRLLGCAILRLQTRGNSRRAPASFSEVVGEFFIYFFKIVWWLLLPLAQDFLASAQGELALNGKCN